MSREPAAAAAGLAGRTRIMVYGVTGSGKSTLAAAISRRTGVPWHAVDELTWEPNWTPVSDDLQRERMAALCAGDAWIIDHGYGTWLDIPWSRVQLVVALDYPRHLSLARLLRRTVVNIVGRRPICNGNHETLRTAVADDSILRWHFRSFRRKRERIRGWAVDPAPPVLVFSRPRQAQAWLRSLGPEDPG